VRRAAAVQDLQAAAHAGGPECVAISFIRTVTVGPGIAPGLLTSMPACAAIERSRAPAPRRRYRRWGLPPRP